MLNGVFGFHFQTLSSVLTLPSTAYSVSKYRRILNWNANNDYYSPSRREECLGEPQGEIEVKSKDFEGFLRTLDGLPAHIRLMQFSPLKGLLGYNLCLVRASSQLSVQSQFSLQIYPQSCFSSPGGGLTHYCAIIKDCKSGFCQVWV